MSLREKIETDYKSALKAKDKNKISTYRLILSGIKDLDINNRSQAEKKETNDEDIKKLLKKMIKQRSESIEMYKKNNRNDLQEVEEKEVEVIVNIYLNNLAMKILKSYVLRLLILLEQVQLKIWAK